MKAADWFLLLLGALAIVMVCTGLAFADDAHDKHMLDMHGSKERDQYFRGLTQPDNGISCCSLADCWPAQAEQKADGNWRMTVRGVWRDVPPNKVIKNKPSIDGEAYICFSQNSKPENATIYCAIPPVPGS